MYYIVSVSYVGRALTFEDVLEKKNNKIKAGFTHASCSLFNKNLKTSDIHSHKKDWEL